MTPPADVPAMRSNASAIRTPMSASTRASTWAVKSALAPPPSSASTWKRSGTAGPGGSPSSALRKAIFECRGVTPTAGLASSDRSYLSCPWGPAPSGVNVGGRLVRFRPPGVVGCSGIVSFSEGRVLMERPSTYDVISWDSSGATSRRRPRHHQRWRFSPHTIHPSNGRSRSSVNSPPLVRRIPA